MVVVVERSTMGSFCLVTSYSGHWRLPLPQNTIFNILVARLRLSVKELSVLRGGI